MTKAGTPIQRLIASNNLKVDYKLTSTHRELVEGQEPPEGTIPVKLGIKLSDELHQVVQNYVRTNARSEVKLPDTFSGDGCLIKQGEVFKRRRVLRELATELEYNNLSFILFAVDLVRDGHITFNLQEIKQIYKIKEAIEFAIDKIVSVGIVLNEEIEWSYRIVVEEVEDDASRN